MQCAVFNTYVPKKEGGLMYFDIIVPKETPTDTAYTFGRQYLQEKKQEEQPLSAKECKFCHIEEATAEVAGISEQKGYHILPMHGC